MRSSNNLQSGDNMLYVKIMLVCGSGASSGFMANSIRKESKTRGFNWEVFARSESEIDNYINEIHCLMVGPHLKYLLPELEKKVEGKGIKVGLLDRSYYSILDGEMATDHIIQILKD